MKSSESIKVINHTHLQLRAECTSMSSDKISVGDSSL